MLRRRLLRTSTVDGPLVNQTTACHSLRRNCTWCLWDAPTIVDRCVVEDTEETKGHKRVLTPFLLLATLSMLHSGNILPLRAT